MITSQYESLDQPSKTTKDRTMRNITIRRPSLLLLFVLVCVLSTIYVISSSLLGNSKRERNWPDEVKVEEQRSQSLKDDAKEAFLPDAEIMETIQGYHDMDNIAEAEVEEGTLVESSENLNPEDMSEEIQEEMVKVSKVLPTDDNAEKPNDGSPPINMTKIGREENLNSNELLPGNAQIPKKNRTEKVENGLPVNGAPKGAIVNSSALASSDVLDLSPMENDTSGTNKTDAGKLVNISHLPEKGVVPKNYTIDKKNENRTYPLPMNGSLEGEATFVLQKKLNQSRQGLSEIKHSNRSEGSDYRIAGMNERNSGENGGDANDNDSIVGDSNEATGPIGSITGNKDETSVPVGESDDLATGPKNSSVELEGGITGANISADGPKDMSLEENDGGNDEVPRGEGGVAGKGGVPDTLAMDAGAKDLVPGTNENVPQVKAGIDGAEDLVQEADDVVIAAGTNAKDPQVKGDVAGVGGVVPEPKVKVAGANDMVPGANVELPRALGDIAGGGFPDNTVGVAGGNDTVPKVKGVADAGGANPYGAVLDSGAHGIAPKTYGIVPRTKGDITGAGDLVFNGKASAPGVNGTGMSSLSKKAKVLLASLPLHFSPSSQDKEVGFITVLPNSSNIFFVESSCASGQSVTPPGGELGGVVLAHRHACSVYAAASLHPNRRVHLYHSCPLSTGYYSKSSLTVRRLLDLPNVLVIPARGRLMATPSTIGLTLVWNYGGTYLSLEALTTRSLDPLGEDWVEADGWALSFGLSDKGRAAATSLLNAASNRLPDPLSDTITRLCSTQGNQKENPNGACSFKVHKAEFLLQHYFQSARLSEQGLAGAPSPLCPI